VLPKATYLGVKEQYYALQALHVNQQSIFSVADFAFHMDQTLRSSIPIRYEEDYTDRSAVFVGHEQNTSAMRMHHAMQDIHEARLQSIIGDGAAALECYSKYSHNNYPLFVRLQASLILPDMGYRYPTFPDIFKDITIDYADLTISELVAALELALRSVNANQFHKLLISSARQSKIDKQIYKYIIHGYRHIQRGNCKYYCFHRLARSVRYKFKSLMRQMID